MKNPFSSKIHKTGCELNQQTGEFLCEKKRIHQDGEEVIASISGRVNESCELAIDDFWENQEGETKELTKKLQEVRGKCQKNRRPSDY